MDRSPLMPNLETLDDVRDFLRICLTPRGPFPGRTVEELATVMPAWLADRLADHAPDVAELRAAADRAREAYVTALGDWITATTADELEDGTR